MKWVSWDILYKIRIINNLLLKRYIISLFVVATAELQHCQALKQLCFSCMMGKKETSENGEDFSLSYASQKLASNVGQCCQLMISVFFLFVCLFGGGKNYTDSITRFNKNISEWEKLINRKVQIATCTCLSERRDTDSNCSHSEGMKSYSLTSTASLVQ